MKNEWGFSPTETINAQTVVASIMKQELAKAMSVQRRAHEPGMFDEKNPKDIERMHHIFETSKVIEQCLVIESFLDHVRKGAF